MQEIFERQSYLVLVCFPVYTYPYAMTVAQTRVFVENVGAFDSVWGSRNRHCYKRKKTVLFHRTGLLCEQKKARLDTPTRHRREGRCSEDHR